MEDEEMNNSNETRNVLIAAFAGAAAGALAGVLLAPASGAETRQKIQEAASDFGEKSKEAINDLKDTAMNMAGNAGSNGNESKSKSGSKKKSKS